LAAVAMAVGKLLAEREQAMICGDAFCPTAFLSWPAQKLQKIAVQILLSFLNKQFNEKT